MRVFWTYGYPHTSIDALTEATGIGKGSLYAAFGSKAELFRLSLQRYTEIYGSRYNAALERHHDDPDGPVAAIRAFYDVVLERLADPAVPDGCLLSQSIADAYALDPTGRELASQMMRQQVSSVRNALRPAGLPKRELDELAHIVVAVNQGVTVMHRSGVPIARLRSVAQTACDLLADRLR